MKNMNLKARQCEQNAEALDPSSPLKGAKIKSTCDADSCFYIWSFQEFQIMLSVDKGRSWFFPHEHQPMKPCSVPKFLTIDEAL